MIPVVKNFVERFGLKEFVEEMDSGLRNKENLEL